jgi:hypothetical protein
MRRKKEIFPHLCEEVNGNLNGLEENKHEQPTWIIWKFIKGRCF